MAASRKTAEFSHNSSLLEKLPELSRTAFSLLFPLSICKACTLRASRREKASKQNEWVCISEQAFNRNTLVQRPTHTIRRRGEQRQNKPFVLADLRHIQTSRPTTRFGHRLYACESINSELLVGKCWVATSSPPLFCTTTTRRKGHNQNEVGGNCVYANFWKSISSIRINPQIIGISPLELE
jgi:hypothetical protein